MGGSMIKNGSGGCFSSISGMEAEVSRVAG